MSRRLASLAALFALFVASVAGASYSQPCEGCSPRAVGVVGGVSFVASLFLDNASDAGAPQFSAFPGEGGNVVFSFTAPANASAPLNASIELPAAVAGVEWLEGSGRDFSMPASGVREEAFAFRVARDAAVGFVRLDFTVAVEGESESGVLTLEVVPAPAPPAAGPSALSIVLGVGAAAVVLGGAAFAVARARRPKARPKSETLQRIEMEKQLESARTVEEKQAIREEIKAVEAGKSRARDLQILEAKRADVERTIDLLKKRHDAGQLTRLQYEKMVEKKLDELDRINEELVAAEAGESSRSPQ